MDKRGGLAWGIEVPTLHFPREGPCQERQIFHHSIFFNLNSTLPDAGPVPSAGERWSSSRCHEASGVSRPRCRQKRMHPAISKWLCSTINASLKCSTYCTSVIKIRTILPSSEMGKLRLEISDALQI